MLCCPRSGVATAAVACLSGSCLHSIVSKSGRCKVWKHVEQQGHMAAVTALQHHKMGFCGADIARVIEQIASCNTTSEVRVCDLIWDHMSVARSACCVIVCLGGLVRVLSCPRQHPCVSRDSMDMPTFILALCSTFCTAHQAEFWVAPRRLAQVIYF